MKYSGTIWRHVPHGAHPLHLGFILRAGGRWNRQGEYGCLYTSFTKEAAQSEYHKFLRGSNAQNIDRKPHDLVSIAVEIEPVVDLTDNNSSPISTRASYLTGDDPDDLERCRSLADYLRTQGYIGIIAPSASCEGNKNLIIYIDGPSRNLRLDVGGKRLPL